MKNIGCCLLVYLLLPAFADAQIDTLPTARSVTREEVRTMRFVDADGLSYVLRPENLRLKPSLRHEFRIGIGALPLCGNREVFDEEQFLTNPVEQMEPVTTYRGPEYTTGAFSLSYGYRFAKRWEVGIALSYAGFSRRKYLAADGSALGHRCEHYWTAMPFVRGFWLERRLVRLYSGVGVGFQWDYLRDYDGHKSGRAKFSGQVTLFGVSVGQRFFGFAEYGIGAHGLLIGGVGYRFDAGQKK